MDASHETYESLKGFDTKGLLYNVKKESSKLADVNLPFIRMSIRNA